MSQQFINLFLPVELQGNSCILLGYEKTFNNEYTTDLHVMCVAGIKIDSSVSEIELTSLAECMINKKGVDFDCIGYMCCETEAVLLRPLENLDFVVKTKITGSGLIITEVRFSERKSENVTVILYEEDKLQKSQLCHELNGARAFIPSHLIESRKLFRTNEASIEEDLRNFDNVSLLTLLIDDTFCFSSLLFMYLLTFSLKIYKAFLSGIPFRIPELVMKIIKMSAVGTQLCKRLESLDAIKNNIEEKKRLTLRCANLLSALILDSVLGVVITIAIYHFTDLSAIIYSGLEWTEVVVNRLQELIFWLMGIPAGLKLNTPLNTALGRFFLYHINLWKTYITVVSPFFATVAEIFPLLGLFGFTLYLSLASDLLSLATVHIYCFYGYAAKLYEFWVTSLSALWRLFRGKKWNPLRKRVDSYQYDVDQLFVGTLVFTVLLFLLPTVALYYTVFTTLRIAVLFVQGAVSRIIDLCGILPLYTLILQAISSDKITGDIHFNIACTEKGWPLILRMELIQVSLLKLLTLTVPLRPGDQQPLSWKAFIFCLITGKIVYPL